MTRGSYIPSSLIVTPGTSLNPASRAVYDFLVALTPSSETGVASINASVFGHDSFTSASVSDLSADTTDTWLIQRAASILITGVNPTQVSIGQTIQPVVQIRNTGPAGCRYKQDPAGQ
jgi:hypothetical protein